MESFCSIFKKTFIFPTDFNDLIIIWGQLGATLVSLGGYLGQLLVHFGYMTVALGNFWVILGSLWAHDAYMWGPFSIWC